MDLATVDHLLTTTRSVPEAARLRPSPCRRRPWSAASISPCRHRRARTRRAGMFMVITDPQKRAGIAEPVSQCLRSLSRHAGAWRADEGRRSAFQTNDAHRRVRGVSDGRECMRRRCWSWPALKDASRRPGCSPKRRCMAPSCPPCGHSCSRCAAAAFGSAWTTLHLMYEKEAAQLLGIPDHITQAALLPGRLLHRHRLQTREAPAAPRSHLLGPLGARRSDK